MSDHIRFRAIVESARGGGHVVEVDSVLGSAGVAAGDTVDVTMAADDAHPIAELREGGR